MALTFDIPDMRARILAENIGYEARADILNLLHYLEDARGTVVRHYHALEEIADALANEQLPTWANQILDEAHNIFEDLYAADPHEDCASLLRPCLPTQRVKGCHAMVIDA